MGRELKAALELQPCCRKHSGIGTYVYEPVKQLTDGNRLESCRNLVCFMERNENSESLKNIAMPIQGDRISLMVPYLERISYTLPELVSRRGRLARVQLYCATLYQRAGHYHDP